ncbi:CotH kinase family protein [Rhodococcus sp. NPDC127528]|uniref:CotH kinase family protein n=1 Tax=unclassified Rhodococcus (in: high G+C Gram-positive bacteria) TaxID=192944 RepID=UPI0036342B08
MITGPPPRRRLIHRVPVSLRQHWKLLVGFVAFVTILATVFGNARIRPYITGDASVIASEVTDNIAGTVDLFDSSVGHEVTLQMPDAEYRDMITSFQKSGEKKWVTADITIDSTLVTDVAVRLKGNSTLMGVRGTEPGGEGFAPPDGMQPPDGVPLPQGFAAPENGRRPEGFGPGGTGGMGEMMASVSADDPTSLPLLISFGENVDGRAYQGLTEISVRPGSPVLNESMALSLTAETNQPTQRFAYTTYSINGGETATRLLVEHPDDAYANALFDTDGYLYKADANSRFAYAGNDQSAYSDQFKQINAVDNGNLQPIINFLKWLDSTSDEAFDAELRRWVDVESFARYVATQNLIVNSDDMAGPGQNYYLWYDFESGLISVISWDLNLAMTGNTTAGPQDTVSIGGGGRPGVTGEAGGPRPPGMPGPRADGSGNTQGGPRGGNTLKARFLGSDKFTELYENTYWDLFEQMYGSGRAQELLDTLAGTVPTSDRLTSEDLQSRVDAMRTWIDQRTAALTEKRVA